MHLSGQTVTAIAASLALVLAPSKAMAAPCVDTAETAKQAVLRVAEIIKTKGAKAVAGNALESGAEIICGLSAVSVIDYYGMWVAAPGTPENVGRTIKSYGDSAATSFINALIQAARERKGALISYLTQDTEHGVAVDKHLFYIDVPSRRLVVYGAFADRKK